MNSIRNLTGSSLLCCGALILAGCRPAPPAVESAGMAVTNDTVTLPAGSPQLVALKIEPVSDRKCATLPLTGRLVWDDSVTVRVFTPFAGIVRGIFADVNQPVRKGMPLAEIQSADFGQAQADARKAESELRRMDRNLARLRDLLEHGAAPRKDVESAESDFAAARSELDRATARLAIYGVGSDSTNQNFLLPSPLDGVIVERNLTPGQEVRPDQMLANMPQYTAPLFVVTDPARLWVLIDVPEAESSRLGAGGEFTFSATALPGGSFTGRVDKVSEFIDANTRTIKVRGSVDNAPRRLKAEMFVSINLPSPDAPGARVPARAVFLNGDKHYVFVEEQPGQFARREVEVGGEQEGGVLVLAGVEPGQRVVTEGCLLLQQSLK